MAAPFDFSAYTETVINAIGSGASPRIKQAFPIMIRKIHEFLIEADVSVEEWMAACNLMVQAGKVSNEQRNEVVLVTDIFGIESLVDTLDQTRNQRTSALAKQGGTPANVSDPTYSAILGPFYRSGVPVQPNGTTILRVPEEAPYCHLFGTVYGFDGKPLQNALVDIWHDAPDGRYDAQSPEKPDYHCRGRFTTDSQGRYATICLRPTPYPIPFDHQAGYLLKLMDRHPFRPAHLHFWIEAEGHKTLITQLFDKDSKYLTDDSVFAVKDKLVVDFKPVREGYCAVESELQNKVVYELEQDFHLAKAADESQVEITGPVLGMSIEVNGQSK